jgi:hypothetical protein
VIAAFKHNEPQFPQAAGDKFRLDRGADDAGTFCARLFGFVDPWRRVAQLQVYVTTGCSRREGVMMRVFLSAQLEDHEDIAEAKNGILSAGHTLPHDWTVTDILTPGFDAQAEKAGEIARFDIEGVLTADVFVILTSNEKVGKGMYAELGAALARAELGLLQHVLVVGERRHESVFYYHPRATHFATVKDCVEHLRSLPA